MQPEERITTKQARRITILFVWDWMAGDLAVGFLEAFMRILHSSPVFMTMPTTRVVFLTVLPSEHDIA